MLLLGNVKYVFVIKMEAGIHLRSIASNLVHDNVVEFVILNLRDITERKIAEEKLGQRPLTVSEKPLVQLFRS